MDELRVLANGSVQHRLVDKQGSFKTDPRLYSIGSYCLDALAFGHNMTVAEDGEIVDFGFICVSQNEVMS